MDLPEDITVYYKVIEKLGGEEGGDVYLVNHLQDGKRYVLKELNLPYYSATSRVQRIVEEIQSTAEFLLQLSNPQLPKFFEFIPLEGKYYFVMEYIDGQDLDRLVEKSKDFFPARKVVEWGIKICSALNYLHCRSFIFKDLQPGHIMLDGRGEIKLIDFGLSKYATINAKTLKIFSAPTPYFSSPEQCEKKEITFASDIYSLGATLYFILTECFPPDAAERLNEVPLQKPSDLNEEISEDLEYIIMKCMNLDPFERYSTAENLRKDFEAFLAGKEISRIYKREEVLAEQKESSIREKAVSMDVSEVADWAKAGKKPGNIGEKEKIEDKPKRGGFLRPRSAVFQKDKSPIPELQKVSDHMSLPPPQVGFPQKDKSPIPELQKVSAHMSLPTRHLKKTLPTRHAEFSQKDESSIPELEEISEDTPLPSPKSSLSQRETRPVSKKISPPSEKPDSKTIRIEEDVLEAVIQSEPDPVSSIEEELFSPVIELLDRQEVENETFSAQDNQLEEPNVSPEEEQDSAVCPQTEIKADAGSVFVKTFPLPQASEPEPRNKSGFIILNFIALIIIITGLYFLVGRQLIAEWHFTRGKELLITNNDPAGAVLEMKKSFEFKGKTSEFFFWTGRAYRKMGDNDKAIEAFKQFLKIEADNPQIYEFLGEIYLEKKEYKNALTAYESILKFKSNNSSVCLKLGQIYSLIPDYPKAIDYYNKYLNDKPADYETRIALSQLYHSQGMPDKAIEEAEESIRSAAGVKTEDMVYIFIYLGDLYFQKKIYYTSIADYMQAVNMNSGAVINQDNLNFMMQYSRDYLKNNPKDVEKRIVLGNVYFIKGQTDAAIKEYNTALSFSANANPDALYYLATVYYKTGEKTKAASYLKDYLTNYPKGTFVEQVQSMLNNI